MKSSEKKNILDLSIAALDLEFFKRKLVEFGVK